VFFSVENTSGVPNSLLPSGTLSTVGSILGGAIGKRVSNHPRASAIGGALGGSLGQIGSRILGFGKYTVRNNTLLSDNSVPTFSSDGNGFRIKHREYIGDISGTTTFAVTPYSINPGVSNVFPWLSQVAQYFEEWEPKGLVFEYRPTSGSAINSSSAALGVVIMATDYNVFGGIFSTKQQMESYEFSNSCVPFDQMLHMVECKKGTNVTNKYFTRGSTLPTSQPAQLYDMGLFQIATSGFQSSYTAGELWVTYDIVLSKPRIAIQPPSPQYQVYVIPNTFYATAQNAPFGFLSGTYGSWTSIASNTTPGVNWLTGGTGNGNQLIFSGVNAGGSTFLADFAWICPGASTGQAAGTYTVISGTTASVAYGVAVQTSNPYTVAYSSLLSTYGTQASQYFTNPSFNYGAAGVQSEIYGRSVISIASGSAGNPALSYQAFNNNLSTNTVCVLTLIRID